MLRQLLMVFAVAAFTASAADTFRITFFQPSVVKGKEFKAGDYRIRVSEQKVVIVDGKTEVEVPATVETAEQKSRPPRSGMRTKVGHTRSRRSGWAERGRS